MICGDLPERTLARSSSTMSWVIWTCMAWAWVWAWVSGPPVRAMPRASNMSAAMMGLVAVAGGCWRSRVRKKEALEAWSSQPEAVKGSNAWREHPGTLQQQAVET